MTETDWSGWTDTRQMLEFLRGKASHRKSRLFACAYCRTFCHLDNDEISKKAVETSERFADGLASEEELRATKAAARAAAKDGNQAAEFAANASASNATWAVGRLFGHISTFDTRTKKVQLLQDLFGLLPFRQVIVDPSWLTHAVVALAKGIYDERRFHDMPKLGDALEEASCTQSDILNHCRQPGEHVCGCWVVDLLLGKQ
jgi:hypothetical protein